MKRRIDPVAIKDVGNYILKQLILLNEEATNLLNDIAQIEKFYDSDDAILISQKYTERVSKIINIITINYENYARYLSITSSAYFDNLNETKSKMKLALENNNANLTTNDTTTHLLSANILNGVQSNIKED